MKNHFTIVLKGHIALASAIFPYGTTGNDLDLLARLPLWKNNMNYGHGTGHGVGSCLSVHEGPHRISKGSFVPLEPGMITSNENLGSTTVIVNVDASGTAVEGNNADANEFGEQLAAAIQAEIINQKRSGGLLA